MSTVLLAKSKYYVLNHTRESSLFLAGMAGIVTSLAVSIGS
jgi:hypothetical protein